MQAYYRIKNLIPAALRHRLNSAAIRMRAKREFPRWPCESALIEYWLDWLRINLHALNRSDAWHIGFWPGGAKCSIVLTHDVEGRLGMSRMEQMADLEERYNFRSAWNLPLAQYEIDWNLIDRLRRRGFEFGAHGLSHDGRLFRSEGDFTELAPLLQELARSHDLNGFRAPSTLRRAEWISKLSFDFDCSFSDSDPYEPQPGGTCSVFPFFLANMVELPYTMPQDHTLIHLLHRSPTQVWEMKAQWIESRGGMILTLVHPDYCGSGPLSRGIRNTAQATGRIRIRLARAALRGFRMVALPRSNAADDARRHSVHRRTGRRARGRPDAFERTIVEVNAVARFLMIAYTTYMHDGRVKRHAEALAERGDHVDVICLATEQQPITNGVNVIGLPMPRYRGASKSAYLMKLHALLFDGGAAGREDVAEGALRRRDRVHDARRRHRHARFCRSSSAARSSSTCTTRCRSCIATNLAVHAAPPARNC